MKNLHWLKGTVAIRDIAYHLIKGFHDGNMSATYRLYKEYGFLALIPLKQIHCICFPISLNLFFKFTEFILLFLNFSIPLHRQKIR